MAQQTQIADIASPHVKQAGRDFVYENDTISIHYDFWHERGLLSFSVYNKLGRPLYIDWSQSSFTNLSNPAKPLTLPYWHDSRKSPDSVFYGKNYYKGETEVVSRPVGNDAHQFSIVPPNDKLTLFVPEHGLIRSAVILYPTDTFSLEQPKNAKAKPIADTGKASRPMPKRPAFYNEANSPLKFVNTLAFTDRASPAYAFTKTHSFYVRGVRTMPAQMFARNPFARPGMKGQAEGMPGSANDSSITKKSPGGIPLDSASARRARMMERFNTRNSGRDMANFNPFKRANCFFINGTIAQAVVSETPQAPSKNAQKLRGTDEPGVPARQNTDGTLEPMNEQNFKKPAKKEMPQRHSIEDLEKNPPADSK
ncbi:MAG: hypothetical protein V4543_04845 [Bacteroidota bacterium]